mmetsp:Transcript_2418/g.3089  ORF Transcript_2418/g.3089 Transcript_2418/m.3089 type:complete len:241 (-) Transcript_2418:1233-1955(-)
MRKIIRSTYSTYKSEVPDDDTQKMSEYSTVEHEISKKIEKKVRGSSFSRFSRARKNKGGYFKKKDIHLRNVNSIVKHYTALQKKQSPYDPPYEILDHLFLGTAIQSRDIKQLGFVGITHVINCEAEHPQVDTNEIFYSKANIKYLEFECKNDDEYDMQQHFEDTFNFIEDCRKEDGKCFLYSPNGRDTSGFLAVTYCMIFKKWTVIKALEHCSEARGKILLNENFQRQLVQFAKDREMLE